MFKFHTKSDERVGEIYVFLSGLLFAGFPVLINYTSDKIPPAFFAAVTTLMGAALMFLIMLYRNQLSELYVKKAWFPMLMVALFIVVIPLPLIYKGTQYTSAINTSILLEAEIIFTLIYTWYVGEKITPMKLLGGLLVFMGTLLILYNGAIAMNRGDLMILLGAAFFPIGNIYAKKALKKVSPVTVVFVRSLLGGIILFLLTPWIDHINPVEHFNVLQAFWLVVLLNGILISGFQKIVWYEGLKRLDVGKATIIVMSYPAFSMILATIFLREIPTLYQFGGLLIIFAGLYSITYYKTKILPHVG